MLKLYKNVKSLNKCIENTSPIFISENTSGINTQINVETKYNVNNGVNITGTKHFCIKNVVAANIYCDNKFDYINKFFNNKYDYRPIYNDIINFITYCSHEYIHNISNKAKDLNNLFNKYNKRNNKFLNINSLFSDVVNLSKKHKFKIDQDVFNNTRHNEYIEKIDSIKEADEEEDKEELERYDNYVNRYMISKQNGGEFFSSNIEFFIKSDKDFNYTNLYIFNNEMNKVLNNYQDFLDNYENGKEEENKEEDKKESKNKKKDEEKDKGENKRTNPITEIYKQDNKKIYLLDYQKDLKQEDLNQSFIKHLENNKDFNLPKGKIDDLSDTVDIDFISNILTSPNNFNLFILSNFETVPEWIEKYIKKSQDYYYKYSIYSNSKKFDIITSEIKTENNSIYYTIFQKNGTKNLKIETLGNFGKAKERNLTRLFSSCGLENIDLSKFNFTNVTSLNELFYNCTNLTNIKFPNCTINNCENVSNMFYNCSKLKNINFYNFFVKGVKNMNSMFENCTSLENINSLENFKSSNLLNINSMFKNCQNLKNTDPISPLNFKNVENAGFLFFNCKELNNILLGDTFKDNKKNINFYSAFYNCIKLGKLDLGTKLNINDCYKMFFDCVSLNDIDLSKFDTSKVENMSFMFFNCNKLENIKGLSLLNTSNCKDMKGMFAECTSLKEIKISSEDNNCKFNTSNVKDMSYMFLNCKSITSLILSNFNTNNVINMEHMFYGCKALPSIDIRCFSFSNPVDMSYMFYGCKHITEINILSENKKIMVKNALSMFKNCKKLKKLNLTNLIFKDTENISNMCYKCKSLQSINVNFDKEIKLAQNKYGIFEYCRELYFSEQGINDNFINEQFLNLALKFPSVMVARTKHIFV